MVHDYQIGSEPKLSFSIKSQLGSPSTLFNASGATNFIYELRGAHFDKVKELTGLRVANNSCKVSDENKDIFYAYKIKELMTNIALGMMLTSQWSGNYEATGGYIIVKEDGDVLCYHIYNRNEFREYLYNNTKFDTPSKSKHHFGVIEEVDSKQILKLNLQIRFVK